MINRKNITLFLIVMILLTFTGCAQINIDTGVDANYNAYLSYLIEVDFESIDNNHISTIIDALDEIVVHYQNELGFDLLENEIDWLQGIGRYELVKKVPHSNYEEAFSTLQDMLTDETITPFMQVDMLAKVTDYQQLYSFKGMFDFDAVYRTTNIESFPQYMQEPLEQDFNSCRGEINISLPGTDLENAIGDVSSTDNGCINLTVPFNLSEPTSLELATRLSTDGTAIINKSMEDILLNLGINLRIWISLGVVAFVATIIGIVLHLRKDKKSKMADDQIAN